MTQPAARQNAELQLWPDRLGAERGASLPPAERELYRWILRRFAVGDVPEPAGLSEVALSLQLDEQAALERMEEKDLVQRGPDGNVQCAYPFSAVPTGIVVHLDGGATTVTAMCAVDALGIPYMLHRSGQAEGSDLATGRQVRVDIDEGGDWRAAPPDAVVLVATAAGDGTIASLCCPNINFFESLESADTYLASHGELAGSVLSLADAVAMGRAVFGSLLD